MEGYYRIGIPYTRFNPLTHTYKSPNRDGFIYIRCIVHVPLVYGQKPYGTCTRVIPMYHYNFIHTYTVVVYAYHMRMTAKAVNTLELIHNCINAADLYNRTQSCNHNCTKYDFTHVRIKHSYV